MTTIGEALIEVRGDTSGLEADVRRGASPSRMGGIGRLAGKGLAVGFTAAAGAVLAGGAFLKGAFDEAQEAQKVGAQTAAAIKATGGAAKISASQIGNLSTSISNKVGIDDEAIQSGANLLLTFKNVRNEVGKGSNIFSRATKDAVDLSAAGFGSIESGSKTLGKALQDPVKGISALGRAGVTFSQDQKDAIKKMVETGDTLGAQKIILKEVEGQVKGSAAAQATAADKAGVAWGNLKEQAGTALMPVLNRVFSFATNKLIPGLSSLGPAITRGVGKAKVIFEQVRKAVGPVADEVVGFVRGLTDGGGQASDQLDDLKATFVSVFASVKSVVADAVFIVTTIWQKFGDDLLGYARTAFSAIMQIVRGAFQVIAGIFKIVGSLIRGDWSGVWDGIKQVLSGAWEVIKGVVRIGFAQVKLIFTVMGGVLKGIFGRVWDGIKIVAGKAWDGIKAKVSQGSVALVAAVKTIPGRITSSASSLFRSAGGKLVNAFVNGLKVSGGVAAQFASAVWGAVKGAINAGIDQLNSLLDFKIAIKGAPDIHVNAPDVGHLARGTSNWRGGLTWVGENGPELMGLPRGSRVIPAARSRAMAAAAAGGGAGGPGGGVAELRITNWREGTGYMRTIADGAISDADDFAGTIDRMGS